MNKINNKNSIKTMYSTRREFTSLIFLIQAKTLREVTVWLKKG